ncbi:MAG TPA: carboxypeptidase regulatory-like domain-containing protein [Candidatus Hydrogenedentes bacterium]|nr:carboxypeptidase regulatory-like domain-containing protein [Candidatus Hydrogenedentota bacterium]
MAVTLAACERPLILKGQVKDVQGQTLPGVAVAVRNSEYEVATDGRGQYSLHCSPGEMTVDFMKTGYTPGVLQVTIQDRITAEARDVVLWPLPVRKGVYLFENFRYQETTRTEPKRYLSTENKPVFGIKRDPACSTQVPITGDKGFQEPLIIAFKMPDYDLQLHRVNKMEAIIPQQRQVQPLESSPGDLPASQLVKDSVWTAVDTIETLLAPVDEQGRQLFIVRPLKPLSSGVYAVHWGALEGHTSTAPEVYLFQVIGPQTPEPDLPEIKLMDKKKPAGKEKSDGEKSTTGEVKPKEEKTSEPEKKSQGDTKPKEEKKPEAKAKPEPVKR